MAEFETPRPGRIDVNPGEEVYCERCEQRITTQYVWLELNQNSLKWTTLDKPWPKAESQGCFRFGLNCYKKALRER